MPPFDPEKPPPFRLAAILKGRDKAFDLLEGLAGRAPSGEGFAALRSALSAVVGRSPDDPAVLETARSLPVRPPTRQDLFDLAWRLAAHRDSLRKGRPLRPWARQEEPEWVPFEVTSAALRRHRAYGLGYAVGLRALAGSPCAGRAEKFWPLSAGRRYAERLGFSRRGRRTLPFKDPRQLVRLRLAAVVPPGERLTFRGFQVPGALKAHNRKLLKARIWREPPCPSGYAHPCHACPVGFAVGEATCPAAVHPVSWVAGWCPSCSSEAWFDPAASLEACASCARRGGPAGG